MFIYINYEINNNVVTVMRLIRCNYLPDLTFLVGQWIHLASLPALESLRELLQVGEGAPDPVVGGSVAAEENAHLEVSRPMFGAPHVGCADPEHLSLAVLAQTRQQLLVVVPPHPLVCND